MTMPCPVPSYFGGDENFPYDVEADFWGFTEHLDDYKPGGLHPIILNDRLGDNGRFRVVHKLGHGGFGTVWLCQDTLSCTPKWRAVKVMSAKTSNPDCRELRAMEAFRDINRSTMENDFHVSTPLEHFWINGPNGRHLALIFLLCGNDIDSLFSQYGYNRALIKDLCFQLAKSLELIHSRGLCHGDFRPQNILVRLCDGIDALPEEALLKFFCEPKPKTVRIIALRDEKPISRAMTPSVPEQLVGATGIDYHSGALAASLTVTDFGVSYPVSDPPKEGCTGIPFECSSPEERFRQRELHGPGSDIWSLGCCILKLALGRNAFVHEDVGDDYDVLATKMEQFMGPMPEPFRSVFRQEHKKQPKWRCFDEEVAKSEGDESQHGELKPICANLPTIIPKEVADQFKQKQLDEIAKRAKQGEHMFSPGQEAFKKRMMAGSGFGLVKEEVEVMTRQWEMWQSEGKKQLPFSEKRQKGAYSINDDQVRWRPDKKEMEELFDLLMSIFKWQPKDRATIEQVLNHPWFEGRNRNAAKVPSLVTTKKSMVDGAVESIKSYLQVNTISRWAQGLP